MKSVSIEEVEQVQADTFEQFIKLFPALMNKSNPSNAEEIKLYFAAKEELTIHMVRILSHYRLFVDRINKASDFEVFSEELFMRQLETYKSKLAETKVTKSNKHEEVIPRVDFKDDDKPRFKVVDNGDFNEIK
jgi:hypothetical protein